MSLRNSPPFRADHVGSLLRTAPLKEARAKRATLALVAWQADQAHALCLPGKLVEHVARGLVAAIVHYDDFKAVAAQ